ncbi:MAG TPA: hypothetical protein VHX20_02710 [Terracidiphilus sp.]|jgi:hypothetical protein|nr:hypothetical protein [Terracidiphilus sp.]
MAEPNETELDGLKRAVTDLLAKKATHKQRIADLEKANAELQTKFGEATASLRHLTVDAPLQELAKRMSTAPELFSEQLSKHFNIDLVEGKLTILTKDDKPVTNKDGKPVSLFDENGLTAFLTDGDDARAKTFRAITIASRASGGGQVVINRQLAAPRPKVQIGPRYK